MPLESAIIETPTGSKHPNYFEVHNQNYQFLLRASDDSSAKSWVKALEGEAKTAALFSMTLSPTENSSQSLISQVSEPLSMSSKTPLPDWRAD